MGLRINTNLASISAQRHLGKSQAAAEHALGALASGSRIVKAGDDPAGLAISENLRGQLGGIRQARMNAENAVSAIQVAEGGLNELNNIVIRLRDLGIQAASDTVSDTEREFLNEEYTQLSLEYDRIAKTTTFGNKKLLDGSGGEMQFHVGPFGGQDNVIKYSLDADATGNKMDLMGLQIKDKDDARDNLEVLDKAVVELSRIRANFGAIQSRLSSTVSNLDTQYENIAAAKGRISDADVAYETAQITQSQVLQEAGIAVMAQANQMPMRASRLINSL